MVNKSGIWIDVKTPRNRRKEIAKAWSSQKSISETIGIDDKIILSWGYLNTNEKHGKIGIHIDATNRDIISEIYQPLTSRGYIITKSEFERV